MANVKKLAPLDWMSASYGITSAADTDTVTGFFDGFVVNQDDSEIDEILDVNGESIKDLMGVGAGVLLSNTTTKRHSTIITSVTMGAGKVTLINAK